MYHLGKIIEENLLHWTEMWVLEKRGSRILRWKVRKIWKNEANRKRKCKRPEASLTIRGLHAISSKGKAEGKYNLLIVPEIVWKEKRSKDRFAMLNGFYFLKKKKTQTTECSILSQLVFSLTSPAGCHVVAICIPTGSRGSTVVSTHACRPVAVGSTLHWGSIENNTICIWNSRVTRL